MSIYDDITIDNDARLVPTPGPRHVRPEGQPARSWPVLPDDAPRVGLVFAPEPAPGVLNEALAQALREWFRDLFRKDLADTHGGVIEASEHARPKYWRRRVRRAGRRLRRLARAIVNTAFVISAAGMVVFLLGPVAYELGA